MENIICHAFAEVYSQLLLSPAWAEGTVLNLSICLYTCLSTEFCYLNCHNSKTKSSMTVELCKDMANDAFYGVNFGITVQCLSQEKSKCIKATTFDRKVNSISGIEHTNSSTCTTARSP